MAFFVAAPLDHAIALSRGAVGLDGSAQLVQPRRWRCWRRRKPSCRPLRPGSWTARRSTGPRITAVIVYLYVGQFLSKKRTAQAESLSDGRTSHFTPTGSSWLRPPPPARSSPRSAGSRPTSSSSSTTTRG